MGDSGRPNWGEKYRRYSDGGDPPDALPPPDLSGLEFTPPPPRPPAPVVRPPRPPFGQVVVWAGLGALLGFLVTALVAVVFVVVLLLVAAVFVVLGFFTCGVTFGVAALIIQFLMDTVPYVPVVGAVLAVVGSVAGVIMRRIDERYGTW